MIPRVPRLDTVPERAVLVVLVGASTLLRFWAGTLVPTPWITPDEVIYGELGRSLYAGGAFRLLGEPVEFFSLVYPALIGPLLSLDDLERGYHWLKLVQALVMSLAAVPAYLWARSLGARGWSVAAAALTLAIPGLAYAGLLMTEVAFYPLVLLAAWAMSRALARGTLLDQGLLVVAVAAAALTRLQAFALVPAFVVALGLRAGLERRIDLVRRLVPTLVGLLALVLAWAAWRLRHGGPVSRVFGAYEPAGASHYSLGDVLRFVLWHLGDVVLFTGVVPAVAVALLAATRERSEELRSYLAVAASLALWLTVEVGLFASVHVGYLAERNLLPLAPVLFVGLAAWLARGGPRPRRALLGAAAAVVVLAAALPAGRLVSDEAFPDSFTILPLLRVERRFPGVDLDLLVPLGAAAACALVAFLPRRLLVLLPVLLGVGFAGISVASSREIGRRATALEAISTGPAHRWIDASADGPTAYLYLGELNWPGVWENVFWNRRVDRVYDLLTARVPGGVPQESVGPLEDGRLVEADGQPARAAYAVAAYPVAFAGRPVATAGDSLVLWRLARPFRLAVWTQRVEGHVRVLAYACRGGTLRVDLEAAAPGTVELRRNDEPLRRVALGAGARRRLAVPAEPPHPLGKRLCTFDVLAGPGVTIGEAVFDGPRA